MSYVGTSDFVADRRIGGVQVRLRDSSIATDAKRSSYRWVFGKVRATALGTLLAALVLAPQAGAACPNEAVREQQGPEVMALPDCMAVEMVSPSKKGNQLARNSGPVLLDGKRVVFNSFANLDLDVPNTKGITGLVHEVAT